MVGRRRRRPARPVVRDRADTGGRVGARSAASSAARSRSCRSTSTRRWRRRRRTSTATTPTTTTRRRRSFCAMATRRSTIRTRPITNDVQRLAGDRARAAAVHDRGLERDADRRPRRGPPAQPHRRPDRDDPVRRLSGRRDARSAPPGRRDEVKLDGQVRQVRCKTRSISGFSRPRRRGRAPRLARAISPTARSPATPAIREPSSSSTATRRRRSPWSRRSRRSDSRRTFRTGTSVVTLD